MSGKTSKSTRGLTILLVEDDVRFAERLSTFLKKEQHHVFHASSGEDGIRLIEELSPDAVLLDLHLPGIDGMETLRRIAALPSSPAIMVMTAHGSITTAVDAMRYGAVDYVEKPVDLEALSAKLERAQQLVGMRSDLNYMLDRERRETDFEKFVGDSPVMRTVYERIREVAKTDNTTVLVTGPSGTGKELASRAIHALSERSKKPFMQIDCTSIPLSLLESELFGHERGAFTGADRVKKGLLEVADRGTLFLDEIGDMPVELQGKFLRVLQERQFRRVGGTRDIPFDVRVIAATHQNLEGLVAKERFRGDLLFRLKVFQVQLPPLRKRGDDILALARSFVRDFSKTFRKQIEGLEPEAERALSTYEFPGNVRELKNIIEQAVILAKGTSITADLLSIRQRDSIGAPASRASGFPPLSLDALGEEPLVTAEKHLIKQALARSGGNKKKAAQLLGISRFSLQRKLEKLTLELLQIEQN